MILYCYTQENQEKIAKALHMLKSLAGEHDHFDSTGQRGAGCSECLRQRETVRDAKRLLDEAGFPVDGYWYTIVYAEVYPEHAKKHLQREIEHKHEALAAEEGTQDETKNLPARIP